MARCNVQMVLFCIWFAYAHVHTLHTIIAKVIWFSSTQSNPNFMWYVFNPIQVVRRIGRDTCIINDHSICISMSFQESMGPGKHQCRQSFWTSALFGNNG